LTEVLNMKKIIGILLLVISTSMFAQDTDTSQTNMQPAAAESVILKVSPPSGLSAEQELEVSTLIQKFEISQALIELDIKDINLKIHREMLDDKPSLKAINNLIDKKSKLVCQLEKNVFEINFKIHELLS